MHGHGSELCNEHVHLGMQGDPTYNEERPFFIGNQRSYSQLPHSVALSKASGGVPAMPAESEKEDLRDVIDNLVMQNKK